MKKQFIPGIHSGAELVTKNIVNNYVAYMKARITPELNFNVDFKNSKIEVTRPLFGGVMVEHVNNVTIGSVGSYLALKNEKAGVETVFCDFEKLASEEYFDMKRVSFDLCDSPLRGVEYRNAIASAAKNSDLLSAVVGQYVVVLDYGLCQVNDADDLVSQIFEYMDGGVKPAHVLAKVEGITEMSDDELLAYDFINSKPEGHEGGCEVFVDDPSINFEYPNSIMLSGSAGMVWLLRGKTISVAVNCEGHFYSKYLYLPANSDNTFVAFRKACKNQEC